MKTGIFSNAMWNVVNGVSGAAAALLVPPFLTHRLSPEAYGAWGLALQIGAYINLLGFGLQVAVGRYVALAAAKNDRPLRDAIVATAFYFLAAAAAIGFALLAVAALQVGAIIPNLPAALAHQTEAAIIILGLAFAINLPVTVFAAVFTGMRRADVPAIIQGSGRLVVVVATILTVFLTTDLRWLAAAYTAASVITAVVLWRAWRRLTDAPRLDPHLASRAVGRELAGYCLSLTVWNLSMLMVNGLDTLIVARWDLPSLPFFTVAVTLSTFVSGILQSLTNPIIPVAAALGAEGKAGELKELLIRGSRVMAAASIVTTAPLIFAGGALLTWWVGPLYATHGASLLAGLAAAAFIRNAMLTYAVISIGTGLQRRMMVTPVVEGVTCVVGALVLAGRFGAPGVVAAKMVGACVGVALLCGQNGLRNLIPTLRRWHLVWRCLIRPGLAWLPLALIAVVFAGPSLPELARLLLIGVTATASATLLSLGRDERAYVWRRGRIKVRQLGARMLSQRFA